ncbi:hypothetical protein NM688_g4321 [Phlebia brevispora]|uniref:Uncharacterized protein n=1 Tax=Phlebia brevispora TaxID=194682 RepID=A0ACC1T2Y4_9APHY|nr:hypothetical protein NM688_g4321 [Phlebia brevispora]
MPNLIAYGLGTKNTKSTVQMFINPYADGMKEGQNTSTWTSVDLAQLEFPVAAHYADITGNGFNDVIICDKYGPSMDDIWPDGGRVSWLENRGDQEHGDWTLHVIGNSPGMHRLKTGYFTRRDRIQICAVPIVVASSDLETPAPVTIFTAPDDPRNHDGLWPSEVVTKEHLVHEVVVIPAEGHDQFDRVLLAGRDGVYLIWFNGRVWEKFSVGEGLPRTSDNPFWGAGSVAVGRIDGDYAGYIASTEAFHGNTVSVYVKPSEDSVDGIVGNKWQRKVLDDYGPLNPKHTGSIHQVVCADIDGDGCDEFLVAMMGSDPPDFDRTGVWCYKYWTFTKTKLSSISAGRIATGHFMAPNPTDFATISYSVPGYFESPNPSVNIFLSTGILAEKLDEEICFRVVRAGSTRFTSEMEFLDVAGRKMTLVVLPPNRTLQLPAGDTPTAVKVMAGSVSWSDTSLEAQKDIHFLAPRPFEVQSMIVSADSLRSGDEGAIFVLFKPSDTSAKPPFSSMEQLEAQNILPAFVPDDVRAMKFPWVKVQDRPWAHGRFKGLEFYNLVGWHVRFADDSADELAHVQMWTAGVGVSAGFHNHVEKSFCEIHACISNGTGRGGMRWATVPDDEFDPANPDLSKTELLVVPDLHEHGALWHTQGDGYPQIRVNDTVDYPWHAWLAGDGDGDEQSFDVWVAFEFPSFGTYSPSPLPEVVKPGQRYVIQVPSTDRFIGLENGSSTDGTLAAAYRKPIVESQQWIVSRVPGTDLYEFVNVQTGSLLCAQWPPVQEQKIIGTHSPANMGITSRWVVGLNDSGLTISLRLPRMETELFLGASAVLQENDEGWPVVLREGGVKPPVWNLQPVQV